VLRLLLGGELGALLAAVAILLLLTAAGFLVHRHTAARSALLHDLAMAGCGGLGAFWLLTRLYA
jgi:hypothetical protein